MRLPPNLTPCRSIKAGDVIRGVQRDLKVLLKECEERFTLAEPREREPRIKKCKARVSPEIWLEQRLNSPRCGGTTCIEAANRRASEMQCLVDHRIAPLQNVKRGEVVSVRLSRGGNEHVIKMTSGIPTMEDAAKASCPSIVATLNVVRSAPAVPENVGSYLGATFAKSENPLGQSRPSN